MFYYPNVLQRHTGCFATIWLAATGATKLLKREYLKVNVPETCEEIMAYILVKVPAPIPGAPQPRFSLYLSAQLQYGVVLVYSRQCQYLVGTNSPSPSLSPPSDAHILERLGRTQQQIRIDLTDLEQPGLLLPDQLALMESVEKAPDPFFGLMEPLLPSPTSIPHVRSILEAPTPERSPLAQLPPSPRRRRAAREPPLTVPPDAITLREAEPIQLLHIEDERDLPEITAQEIDLLMEQEGFLGVGEERPLEVAPIPPRKRRAEEESAEAAREQELGVPPKLSPPTRVEEEPSAARETEALLSEEVRLPKETLMPWEVTPPPAQPPLPPPPRSPSASPRSVRPFPPSPELHLPVYEPSPARPAKRRRQLRFSDPVTQISREDFQKQILDPQTQCQPLEAVLFPARRPKTPAELLETPTYGWMHPTLHQLWAHCAKLQPVDYAKQRAAEEAAAARRAEEAVERAEVPSELEELRAAEEPSVPPLGSSGISLETTEEEPHPSLVLEEERALPEPEEAVLPMVPELPEISFDLPLEKDAITLDYVRRLVTAKLEQAREITFDQLGPLTASRAVACRFFYLCLVLATSQYLRLEQTEPFGQILITGGARFPLH
ncbi:hypothetical protein lerEdw1_010179 [Lerista edwardsae]|nr:hypothetical protein lerEdw1_010179 [Lerista edwardsae]